MVAVRCCDIRSSLLIWCVVVLLRFHAVIAIDVVGGWDVVVGWLGCLCVVVFCVGDACSLSVCVCVFAQRVRMRVRSACAYARYVCAVKFVKFSLTHWQLNLIDKRGDCMQAHSMSI